MKSVVRVLAVAAAVVGTAACAQDLDDVGEELSSDGAASEEQAPEGGATSEAEAGSAENAGRSGSKADARAFYTIPTVFKLEGVAQILKPGTSEWVPVVEGLYYPLGSTFRTVGPETRMIVRFGRECGVEIEGEASFGTRRQGLGEKSRAVTLKGGVIKISLPRNLPEGLFMVDAPGFSVVNLAGDSVYGYEKTGDGDDATVRCVTGSFSIKGRHFVISSMKAANEVRIRTSQDILFTGLYGVSGDCECRLDQGLVKVTDVETGESHIDPKFLDWKLSPQSAVRIHRAVPKIGKNMSVSVMTFDALGNMKNRCAFTENRFENNSGELVPKSKEGQEDVMKKAAEATAEKAPVAAAETVEVAPAESEEQDNKTDDNAPKNKDADDDLDF